MLAGRKPQKLREKERGRRREGGRGKRRRGRIRILYNTVWGEPYSFQSFSYTILSHQMFGEQKDSMVKKIWKLLHIPKTLSRLLRIHIHILKALKRKKKYLIPFNLGVPNYLAICIFDATHF